jgi:flagellar hook-basal body complex protein FliE
MSTISGVGAVPTIEAPSRTHRVGPTERNGKVEEKESFADALDGAIEQVDDLHDKADRTVLGLSTGEVEDVHQVMIAMNEADIAFRMMLEVRNRIVDAYKEVSRLQV